MHNAMHATERMADPPPSAWIAQSQQFKALTLTCRYSDCYGSNNTHCDAHADAHTSRTEFSPPAAPHPQLAQAASQLRHTPANFSSSFSAVALHARVGNECAPGITTIVTLLLNVLKYVRYKSG